MHKKIKYQLGHLMVKSGHQEVYDSEFWLMKDNGGIIRMLFLCFCILNWILRAFYTHHNLPKDPLL